jgi:phage head maturation protease
MNPQLDTPSNTPSSTTSSTQSKRCSTPIEIKTSLLDVEDNTKPFRWEGYASQYGNVDTENDIVAKGAFNAQIGKTVAAYWEHKTAVGKILVVGEDEYGLIVEGQLFDNEVLAGTPEANLNQLMRALYQPTNSIPGVTTVDYFMSIGYVPTQVSYKSVGSKRVRVIEKAELVEVSLVRRPANIGAVITSVKALTTDLEPVDNTALHSRINELETSLFNKTNETASLVSLINIQSEFIRELSAKTLK